MSAVILRRRKLGKGSTNGIVSVANSNLSVVRNWRDRFPADTSIVIRWGCTSNVPTGTRVVNFAESIRWCSDKRQGRLDMQAAGVSVPETWDWESWRDNLNGAEGFDEQEFIARPATHAQGRMLVYGTGDSVYQQTRGVAQYMNGYVSRKIDKVAEYRVLVCQNRVAWVAQKTPADPSAIAWNVAQGGSFSNVRWGEWPMAVISEALKAAKVSGTDFCGVDVMVDAEGNAYVLEVNSAPSQTSPYRQQCLAKCFDYMVDSELTHFPDPVTLTKWQHVIHPAVWGSDD